MIVLYWHGGGTDLKGSIGGLELNIDFCRSDNLFSAHRKFD